MKASIIISIIGVISIVGIGYTMYSTFPSEALSELRKLSKEQVIEPTIVQKEEVTVEEETQPVISEPAPVEQQTLYEQYDVSPEDMNYFEKWFNTRFANDREASFVYIVTALKKSGKSAYELFWEMHNSNAGYEDGVEAKKSKDWEYLGTI